MALAPALVYSTKRSEVATRDRAYLSPVPIDIERLDIVAVERDGAGVRVVEAKQKLGYGRFPTARWTHES